MLQHIVNSAVEGDEECMLLAEKPQGKRALGRPRHDIDVWITLGWILKR
jgi:hypothetical protein